MNAYLFKYVPIAYMDACLSIFAKSIIELFFFGDFKPSFDFFLSSISQRKSLIGKVISSGHQWTDS